MLRNAFLIITFLLSIFFMVDSVKASPVWKIYVNDSKQVGKGRLTYLFWDIYNATLYAPDGQWVKEKPFALELTYLRNLKGKKIADRTIEEIRKQGFHDEIKLATWHTQLRKIIPNVAKNMSLVGVYTPSGSTRFYFNGDMIGEMNDPQFSDVFFDIWLGEKTSEPYLRQKLLGYQ
jgi:hypothetical protein